MSGEKRKGSDNATSESLKKPKREGGRKKVTVGTFKGMPLVNIREFYTDKESGEEKPGSKGIALNTAQWEKLVELLPELQSALADVQKDDE